jgi:hypothetical protein
VNKERKNERNGVAQHIRHEKRDDIVTRHLQEQRFLVGHYCTFNSVVYSQYRAA